MIREEQKIPHGQIRVLQLIHSSHMTGPGRIVFGIARYLDKGEFAVSVLCPKEGIVARDLGKIGVRVIPFCGTGIAKTWRLFGILKKERYHILHIHSGQIGFWAKCVGTMLRIPVIVYTEHLSGENHDWIKNRVLLSLHLLLHRIANAMVDCIVAVSEAARKSFLQRQGIAPEKVITIYNGIELEKFVDSTFDAQDMRKIWGIEEGMAVVGVVARLFREKGHECFVLAANEVLKNEPKVKFLIVGEGPERQAIENLLDKLKIKDNVTLTGFVEDIAGIMEIMDVVVQPSLAATESFGLTVAEAMAKKKPVIASSIDCFKEIIEDGQNGILFPAGDYQRLAEKIMLLLGAKGLRAKIAAAGYQTVQERFDIRMTVVHTQTLYKKLLIAQGFSIQGDLREQIMQMFVDTLLKERVLLAEKANFYRESLLRYLSFIKDRRLTLGEAAEYLSNIDNLLVETFLQFLEQKKIGMDEISSFNNSLFKEALRAKVITARDYDERIRMQTLQFQIDAYYEPKTIDQQKRIAIVLSELKPHAGEKILDIGCGVGTFAYHCAKEGAQSVGIDYSQESLATAKELGKHFGLSRNLEYICCDISKRLPFEDRSFDKIAAIDFIEHIDDVQKKMLLLEMARVLTPEGAMVIFTPNALREKLGAIKAKMSSSLGIYASETRLHYGLTSRFSFEKMLKDENFTFGRKFFDVGRPYLAKIPILNEFLSLNILWVIRKK